HPRHGDQHGLDLRRIDVDAAGDHHVAHAVAQEQIAVLVQVTDIAAGDQAVALDLAPALRHAVIGEVRKPAQTYEDLADLLGAELLAGDVKDLDDRTLDRPPDGSGL